MKKLYVIGNGFDLNFGLSTKTRDFVTELEKITFDCFSSARDIYSSYGVDWSSFEEDLANLDLEEIDEEVTEAPDYMADLDSTRDGVVLKVEEYTENLLDAREKALRNMIANAEKQISKIGTISYADYFDSNGVILSFNYTSTVESLFDYDKEVFHIHGSYNSDDVLVFGFKSDSADFERYSRKLDSAKNARMQQEILELKNNQSLSEEEKNHSIEELEYCYEQEWNDPFLDKEYEAIANFYQKNKKNFQYDKLDTFLNDVGKIDQVVVLGHGLGDVDREYFELIEKTLSPSYWIVSAYDDEDVLLMKKICESYSFKDKVNVLKMKDILTDTK